MPTLIQKETSFAQFSIGRLKPQSKGHLKESHKMNPYQYAGNRKKSTE